MSLATVREAMSDALDAIDGLRAVPYVQDQVAASQAVVARGEVTYHLVFGESATTQHTYLFTVSVYANRTAERSAQVYLDTLVDASDDNSVPAALEAKATATAAGADYIFVRTASPVGVATIGAIDYLTVEFEVEAVF